MLCVLRVFCFVYKSLQLFGMGTIRQRWMTRIAGTGDASRCFPYDAPISEVEWCPYASGHPCAQSFAAGHKFEDTTMWYIQDYLNPIGTVVKIIIRHSYHRIIYTNMFRFCGDGCCRAKTAGQIAQLTYKALLERWDLPWLPRSPN